MDTSDSEKTLLEGLAEEVYTLADLEQLKALADPLRLRILELLIDEERTTKQVADLLSEKPTRLYHHVDALEKVGLIRLTATRQNRGTVEKYYRAVAKLFRAAPSLFRSHGARETHSELAELITNLMDSTSSELRRLIDSGYDLTEGPDSVLSYAELRATEAEVTSLCGKVQATLEGLTESSDGKASEDVRRYRLLVALFPID